jgi:ribosomal protein L14
MISVHTCLVFNDGTGLIRGRCLKVYKGYARTTGTLGDFVAFSIIKKRPRFKIKAKRLVYLGVIIGVNRNTRRKTGHYFNFRTNKALALADKTTLLSRRISHFLPTELRDYKIDRLRLLINKFL